MHGRHIFAQESHCADRGHSSETIFHTMFECTYALWFWEGIKEMTGQKEPRLHPLTWAKDLLTGGLCSEGDSTPCLWLLIVMDGQKC